MANKYYDKFVRAKTRAIAFNVFVTLGIFIVLNYFEWDGTAYSRDSHHFGEAMRAAICVLSFALAYQIFDRQRLVLGLRWLGSDRERKARLSEQKRHARQQRLKLRGVEVTAITRTRDKLLSVPLVHINELEMPSARAVLASRGCRTIPLLCMCFILPYPYVQGLTGGLIPDEVGLFMFLRLAVVIWVIRDESKIYQHREELKHAVARYSPDGLAPVFGYWMAIKAVYIKRPFRFILVTFLAFWGTFSYTIWILERETNEKGLNSYYVCLLVSLNNMLFSWPDDIYFTHQPESQLGKMACAGAALSGMLILTLLLGVAANTLILTRAEASMINYVNLRKAKKEERQAAAALIQFCWRSRRLTALMMQQEQEDKRQARVLDRKEHKSAMSDDDDEEVDLLTFDETRDRPPRHGPREESVVARFKKQWKADESRYKVGFEARLHTFRYAHRTRMELEPEKVKEDKDSISPQAIATIEKLVQQTMRETLTTAELSQVMASSVEATITKALKNRLATRPTSPYVREQKNSDW